MRKNAAVLAHGHQAIVRINIAESGRSKWEGMPQIISAGKVQRDGRRSDSRYRAATQFAAGLRGQYTQGGALWQRHLPRLACPGLHILNPLWGSRLAASQTAQDFFADRLKLVEAFYEL